MVVVDTAGTEISSGNLCRANFSFFFLGGGGDITVARRQLSIRGDLG